MTAPHARDFVTSLPPQGAQFAPRGGPSVLMAPHARDFVTSLPPQGAQFAPRGGPSVLMAPHARGFATSLPRWGAQFAPRGGPPTFIADESIGGRACERIAHEGGQHVEVERLREMVVEARFLRASLVFALAPAGHGNEHHRC